MRQVNPQVFLVSSMENRPGMGDYLAEIGAIDSSYGPDWTTDAKSPGDKLVEVGGRLCYRSWMPWDENRPDCSNMNVEKIRGGNVGYLANVMRQGHGSVLEHHNIAVIFHNVSRVFTHELVRHRAGMGYSQESLRYVRLNDLRFWIPGSAKAIGPDFVDFLINTITYLEGVQTRLSEMSGIEGLKDFALKKALTSMFRRLAPQGMATTIMATGNVRAWRHILNMRGAAAAEEEMQIIMPALANLLISDAPGLFQDVKVEGGIVSLEWTKV